MSGTPKSGKRKQSGKLLHTMLTAEFCLILTLGILWQMLGSVGAPRASRSTAADVSIPDRFDAFAADMFCNTLNEVIYGKTGNAVQKVYWIEEGTLAAPEPNRESFGTTEDPSTLQWLLDEAGELLDGQETYFSTETQLFSGSEVTYYLDETIFAVTWKEVHHGSVYTFSEIKIAHPSQFRRHLAGGEFGSEMLYYPTEMAESVNAVVASAGDFYRFRDFGISVYEGRVRRVEGTYAETCFIDSSGDLHFVYGGEILDTKTAQSYVDENDIRFSLAFGPVLVDNYEIVEHSWYGVGEIMEGYARSALCQMGKLHYIVVTANAEGSYQVSPAVSDFARVVAATGCSMAYCLDGGQTATIVMNDCLINRPVYGEQRKISDIIYFATAVPGGG